MTDDCEGKRQRERGLKVRLTVRDERVDQPVGFLADPRFEAREAPRHEEGVDAGPESVVVRVVDPEERPARGDAPDHIAGCPHPPVCIGVCQMLM